MGSFIRLKKEGFEIPPGRKVIKARAYAAYTEAADLVASAREEAEAILAEARQVYETEKKRGYREGLEKGKERAVEQITKQAQKTAEYYGSIETKVVGIVTQALKKILGEIGEDEVIVRVVKNILNLARNQKQVSLRVAPAQVEVVKGRLEEITAKYPVISFVSVEADPRLKAGGCIMESDFGVVDAGVDFQLEALKRSLEKSLKPSLMKKVYDKLDF